MRSRLLKNVRCQNGCVQFSSSQKLQEEKNTKIEILVLQNLRQNTKSAEVSDIGLTTINL